MPKLEYTVEGEHQERFAGRFRAGKVLHSREFIVLELDEEAHEYVFVEGIASSRGRNRDIRKPEPKALMLSGIAVIVCEEYLAWSSGN